MLTISFSNCAVIGVDETMKEAMNLPEWRRVKCYFDIFATGEGEYCTYDVNLVLSVLRRMIKVGKLDSSNLRLLEVCKCKDKALSEYQIALKSDYGIDSEDITPVELDVNGFFASPLTHDPSITFQLQFSENIKGFEMLDETLVIRYNQCGTDFVQDELSHKASLMPIQERCKLYEAILPQSLGKYSTIDEHMILIAQSLFRNKKIPKLKIIEVCHCKGDKLEVDCEVDEDGNLCNSVHPLFPERLKYLL